MRSLILLTAVFICCLGSSYSQPGQLDPSFGNNGIVTTDSGNSTSAGYARGQQVLTQNDGSIYLIVSNGSSSSITRFHANGTIDSSYGYLGNSKFIPFQITRGAFQSDGKIVVVGYAGEYPDYDISLGRYNADGSIDTTFSGDGMLTTDFEAGQYAASSVAIQSDGRIVVACTSAGDFALARYNTNGTLDITFSEDGKVTTDFASGNDGASFVAIQNDGKIVAAGTASTGDNIYPDNTDIALARYNTDGSPDTTFSGDGIQTTDIQPRDIAASLALQDDGKIVVAGNHGQTEEFEYFTLARYNTNGSLDTTFSGDGIEIPDFPHFGAASVAIQADGRIVVAGTGLDYIDGVGYVGDQVFAVARYNTDGSPDSAFSDDGRQTTNFGGNQGQYPRSVVIRSDGSILAAGTVFNDIPFFALVRYNTDGTLDTTFSEDGKLEDYVHVSDTYYTSVAIQGDGKIVAGGNSPSGIFTGYGWASQGAFARYNTDGSLDTSFSNDGKETTDFTVSSVALQRDEKIVVAGTNDDGYSNFDSYVLRYNIDGTRDNFYEGYYQEYTFLRSAAIQGDGKIIVVSTDKITRLNADGTPDSTFSDDGNQSTGFDARSIDIQSDGKIVVVGSGGVYPNADFAIARYNADGSLDQTFSRDGKQTTDFGTNNDIANDIAIQSDGKLVVIGNAGDTSYFALARYNTDGTLDAAFSEDGKQTALTGSANAVAIQSDGKIVVGGSNGYFALARFNTDGSLDNSFGTNGQQVTERSEGAINDIAISGIKLYAAGYHQNPGRLGAVARYLLDESKNKMPTVTLSIPYNVVKYSAPARIKLIASATDEDGKITKVQFYNGTTRLHTQDASPYGFLWVDVPAGNYKLTAKAFDNSGNVATSNSIEVSVVQENVPPVVNIVSPADDTTYTGPATITIIAEANDSNDRIAKVEFYSGTALIRTEYIYPYRYRWSNVQPGNYTITAKAYDDKGLSTTSEPVTVTVSNASIVSKPSSADNEADRISALSLRVSPNPTRNILHISINGLQLNKQATISVLSAAGATVKTMQMNSLSKVVQLNVSSLISGAYAVKVISGDKVMYAQFVKF